MRILVLNGPNLDMTGKREPEIYGTRSLDDIIRALETHAAEHGASVEHVQTNYEGRLIDELHAAGDAFDGVLINPGALTHYSYALRDAIACTPVPVGAVHMSDITKREPFRAVDVIEDVCAFRVMGMGARSYTVGLDRLIETIEKAK